MLYELAKEINNIRPLPAPAPSRLRSVARALLMNLPRLDSLEGTRHPYGFVVVRLGRVDDTGELRLHLWPAEHRPRQKPDWPLHSHPWHVKSFVIAGRLLHTVYAVETLGHGTQQLYQIAYTRGTSELKRTPEAADARLLIRETVVSGTVYELDCAKFHEVDAPAMEFAATIVLTGPDSGIPPRVLGAKTAQERFVFAREQLQRDALITWINQAQNLM